MGDSKEMAEQDYIVINAIENIQRKNVSPFELGRIASQLLKLGLSRGEVAARLAIPKSRVDSTLSIFTSFIPEEYRGDIEYMSTGHGNKKGKIGASVAHQIYQLGHTFGFRMTDSKKLFALAKEKEYSGAQIQLIGELMSTGMDINDAIKNTTKYSVNQPRIVFNKVKLEAMRKEHKMKMGELTVALIKGKIPYRPGLLF